jgi:hypothetical protein
MSLMYQILKVEIVILGAMSDQGEEGLGATDYLL